MGRASRLRVVGRVALVVVLLGVAYLLAWPTKVEPVAWPRPAAVEVVANEGLVGGVEIEVGEGPEDVAVAPDGRWYTGLQDGRILRMQPDGGDIETFVQTQGRPLGLAFARDGALWVADARRGVLRVGMDAAIEVVIDEVEGTPVHFADELAFAPDGTLWVSEASRRWEVEDTVLDVLEGQATGRLLHHDPQQGTTRVALDGLRFANGVVVAPDGSHVLVAETFAYRVTRLWLTGARAGTREVLIENLPGFCDNLDLDADGTLWIALPSRRSAIVDALLPHPFARKMLARIPLALQPVPPPYGHVVGVGLDGTPRFDLQDPGGRVHTITSATPVGERLVIGSLHAHALVHVPRPRP